MRTRVTLKELSHWVRGLGKWAIVTFESYENASCLMETFAWCVWPGEWQLCAGPRILIRPAAWLSGHKSQYLQEPFTPSHPGMGTCLHPERLEQNLVGSHMSHTLGGLREQKEPERCSSGCKYAWNPRVGLLTCRFWFTGSVVGAKPLHF